MKQVVQDIRSGETSVVDVPVPIPQSGCALVKTTASLVSAGTERMLVEFAIKSLVGKARSRPDLVSQTLDKARREGWLTTLSTVMNRLDQPIALGYSSAGRVVELGEGLQGYQTGQPVACAGGGYAVHAEYVNVPQNLLAPLPEELDLESAAFTTLGAIALHGFRLSQAALGENVAVIGLGLLGMLTIQIARAAGCRVLGVDIDPQRVQLGRDLGFQATLREQAKEAGQGFTHGSGFDVVIICADTPSSDPVELAGDLARQRAQVVAVGAVGQQLPRKVFYEKELFFVNSRSYGPGRYDPTYEQKGVDYPLGYVRWTEGRNMQAFIDLLASGKVEVKRLVTHRFPIEQAPQAYRLITGKEKEPFLGVLLIYPDDQPLEGLSTLRTVAIQPRVAQVNRVARTPADRIHLGMLGAGNFASTIMLPILRRMPEIELVGVVSASGMSAQFAARRYGFRFASSQPEQLLNDPAIDTLAIFTRHNLHTSQAMAGLKAGKHVFCEKPLAIDQDGLSEIEAVLGLLAQMQTENRVNNEHIPQFMVGFNRRFARLMIRLVKFLEGRSEPLFAHYRVNAGYLPPTHWLNDPLLGGGRLVGEGCHFIDTLTFLVGKPPCSVTANALLDSGHYSEDNVLLTFDFPDGSLGTLAYLANGDKAFPKERLEVFCGGKVAVLDDFRVLELVQRGKRVRLRSRLRQDKGHYAEWQAFCDSILQNSSPPIPYDHLVGVTRASLAAAHAVRSGERIDLSPDR